MNWIATNLTAELLWRHVWQITLLIPVAIWLTRWTCKGRPHLAYALLLVCLAKCVIPPVWGLPGSVFYWLGLPLPTRGDFTWWGFVGIVLWIGGTIALLGYLFGKRWQLIRFHEDTEVDPPDELLEIVEEVGEKLDLQRTPRVLVTVHPTIPFASGPLRPRIVLPDHLVLNASFEDLRLIVAHEMTHLRRGDLLLGAFQLVVQSLFWFHPLVWWLNREIRRVREECCDQEVLVRLACLPREYASCLINVLELQQRLRSLPDLAGLKPLEVTEERLKGIMQTRRPVARLAGVGWLVVIVLALQILPGGNGAASTIGEGETQGVIADRNSPLPVPPAPRPPVIEFPQPEPIIPGPTPVELRYGVELQQVLTYSIEIVLDKPEETHSIRGSVLCRFPASDNTAFALQMETFGLLEMNTPKPRQNPLEIPGWQGRFPGRPPGFPAGLADFPRGIPSFPRPLPPWEREQHQPRLDRHGRTIQAATVFTLPLLLGDVQQLLFPEVPAGAFREQTSSRTEQRRQVAERDEHLPPRGYPYHQPQEITVGVEESVTWKVELVDEARVTLLRTSSLRTISKVDNQPAQTVDLEGKLVWDRTQGLWEQMDLSGTITAREPQTETRIPLTVTVSRQEAQPNPTADQAADQPDHSANTLDVNE